MKALAYAMMFALFFTATAEAKKKKGKGKGKGGGKADKEKVERQRKRDEEKKAVDAILAQKDTDNNKQLTMQEWVIGESDEGAAINIFIEFDKNKDRKLTRTEIGATLGY